MNCSLEQQLQKLVEKWPRCSRSCSGLEWGPRAILAKHWEVLHVEAVRLSKQRWHGGEELGCKQVIEELRACVEWAIGNQHFESIRRTLSGLAQPPGSAEILIRHLRLGVGSPGYTGCLPVAATSIRWDVFTDSTAGILKAMGMSTQEVDKLFC